MRLLAPVLACALLASLSAVPAAAQDAPPRWTVGLLAIDANPPYAGFDRDPLVVPLLRFEGERTYVRGLRGGWRATGSGPLRLDLFAEVRLDGYEASDAAVFAGMADRDPSLDAGASLSWATPAGEFSLSAATDVLDRSGGSELGLGWQLPLPLGDWLLVPSLDLRWQDADLLGYYYGVRPGEARPGRPAYAPGSGRVLELGVLATRPIGKHWQGFARVGVTRWPDAVRDSPLVDDDRSTSVLLGLGYAFD